MSRPRLQVTPDHNLALDLVRTTEAAALATARWVGRGDKNAADQAAVDAMRLLFNSVPFDGLVVIGEGEKDEAPMLFNGEVLGTGVAPSVDVAVDPIDGTRLVARGEANAMSVVAVAQRGSMFNPGPCVYMEKIAAGREAGRVIDIAAPIEDNVRTVARARGMEPEDITVVILDRDRHQEFIERVRRDRGARLPDHRRRRRRRHHGRPARHGRRPALRHRRHPRGRHCRGRTEVPGREPSRAASIPAMTRNGGPPSTPATTSTACSPPTISSRATTSSSPPPASPTACSWKASATTPTGRPPSRS